jgi:hypothetical protein
LQRWWKEFGERSRNTEYWGGIGRGIVSIAVIAYML